MTPKDFMTIIDHNLETKPRPAHMNKDLMTCAMQMEQAMRLQDDFNGGAEYSLMRALNDLEHIRWRLIDAGQNWSVSRIEEAMDALKQELEDNIDDFKMPVYIGRELEREMP